MQIWLAFLNLYAAGYELDRRKTLVAPIWFTFLAMFNAQQDAMNNFPVMIWMGYEPKAYCKHSK